MTQEVERNYLEIHSIRDLNEAVKPNKDCSLNLLEPINFQLNKFFYKNIGKKHKWTDRLVWTEAQWIEYVSSKKVKTYILKYQNKKLGSYLLSKAIKKSFVKNINRVWVHTCSLDHKNALTNYVNRGMKIFKTEIIKI